MKKESYNKAFFMALGLHLFLGFLLILQANSQQPVLVSRVNELNQTLALENNPAPKVDIIKAASIDSQEVKETLIRLKQDRAQQLKTEQLRQSALAREAEVARKARLQEQQRLAQLKEEAKKLAIEHKKRLEEEQQRLKQLSLQKELETKRLEELKIKQQALQKTQQEEAERLSRLQKKQAEEKRLQEEKAQAERFAALEAAKKAQMAGEVDKYKALIINAISQQWILPESADKRLSSKFRIRLAPSGKVLEVSLIRSSGDTVLDRSAQTAIYKASPLPVPGDPAVFDLFRDIDLTVKPENVRG